MHTTGVQAVQHFIGVSYAYTPGHLILNDADLLIQRGKPALILGDNGSGKTTLMKYISGLLTEKRTLNPSVANFTNTYHRQFIYFPDDLLFPFFTVEEYLYLSLQARLIRLGRPYREFLAKARRALEQSTIVASPKTLISELSSGNRTLLRFLALYLNKYDFLLLDEPTSHLDDQKVVTLLRLLDEYVTEHCCFCLISSHDPRLTESSMASAIEFKYRLEGKKIVRIW